MYYLQVKSSLDILTFKTLNILIILTYVFVSVFMTCAIASSQGISISGSQLIWGSPGFYVLSPGPPLPSLTTKELLVIVEHCGDSPS